MVDSQAPLQPLGDVRNDRLRWPLIDDPPREMARREKMRILGGHDLWRLPMVLPESSVIDALWRSAPRNLRRHILQEILERQGHILTEALNIEEAKKILDGCHRGNRNTVSGEYT